MSQERIRALEARVNELVIESGNAAVENNKLRAALQKLLELDEQRPADPTWWRKWWDEARGQARAVLGERGGK